MDMNGLEGEDRAIPAALDRSAAPSGSSPVPGLEQSPLPHIAAHTPGPWQDIAGTTTGRRVISLAAVAKARTTIAHVGGPDRDANARLIAAAPDLFNAALAAKRLLTPELDEPGRTVFWALVDAVNKASGK